MITRIKHLTAVSVFGFVFLFTLVMPALTGYFTAKADAITANGRWENAANFSLTSIVFTEQDRSKFKDRLGNLTIDQINTYVSQQVVGQYKTEDLEKMRDYLNGSNDAALKVFYLPQNGAKNCPTYVYMVGNKTYMNIGINIPAEGCKRLINSDFQRSIEVPGIDNSRANIWFGKQDDKTYIRADGVGGNWVNDGVQANKFFKSGESSYTDWLEVQPGASTGKLNINMKGENNVFDVGVDNSSPPKTGDGKVITGTGGGAGGGSSEATCESEAGVLAWIMCSVLTFLEKGISGVDSVINALLYYDFDKATNANGPNGGLKNAWARLRNLAFLILIPMMLVMVISTALGFGFVDAYTLKKSLPRMLAAIIFISLSWDICKIMIDVTNALGRGMAGFVSGAVVGGGTGALKFTDIFTVPEGFMSILVVGAAAGIGFMFSEAVMAILGSLALVVFAVLLLTVAVLALRITIITGLILLSPLAILSWIFPGNDKLWKLWWNSFSKLLLLYPIIILLITTGKVFAWIIQQQDGNFFGHSILDFILKFIAYIGPYFFIPATFKLAGGAFASIAGMANDKSRGLFDSQKKKRQTARSKGWNEFKNQSLQSKLGRSDLVKRIGGGVGVGLKGRYGRGIRGEAAMDAGLRGHAANTVMKDPTWQQVQHDDMAMRAASYKDAEAALAGMQADGYDQADVQAAIAKVQGTVGFGAGQQIAAAQQMLLNKTAYKDAEDVAKTIARVSGGSKNTEESMRGFNNAYAKQVGRHDLSAVGSDMVGVAAGRQSGNLAEMNRQATIKGFENADTFTLGRENKISYENMAKANLADYRSALAENTLAERSGDANRIAESRGNVIAARSRLEETVRTAGGATGVNARTITALSEEIARTDGTMRKLHGSSGDDMFDDATISLGHGGIPRTGGTMSPEQRAAAEAALKSKGPDED